MGAGRYLRRNPYIGAGKRPDRGLIDKGTGWAMGVTLWIAGQKD